VAAGVADESALADRHSLQLPLAMTVEPSIFEVFPSPLSWEIVLKALPLLSLALLLAGCVVQSPESRMGEAGQAPVRWSATAQAKQGIDDQWVERFGAGELKALVAQAYNANRAQWLA
jgi:hypothetical protein